MYHSNDRTTQVPHVGSTKWNILRDGSSVVLYASIPIAASHHPTIVCFHGSGGNTAASWSELIGILSMKYRLIMVDRGANVTSVPDHIGFLQEHLSAVGMPGPYILLAHSYGGTFAKQYLCQHRENVVGVVLVETGKSPEPIDCAHFLPWKRGKGLLGSKPLLVIRGDSLQQSRQTVDDSVHVFVGEAQTPAQLIASQRVQLLVDAERKDENLEKAQLQISSRHKYVHMPDCGHNIIRDRPDVVKDSIEWVFDNLSAKNDEPVAVTGHTRFKALRSWRLRSMFT